MPSNSVASNPLLCALLFPLVPQPLSDALYSPSPLTDRVPTPVDRTGGPKSRTFMQTHYSAPLDIRYHLVYSTFLPADSRSVP